jgi:hypothetical protein
MGAASLNAYTLFVILSCLMGSPFGKFSPKRGLNSWTILDASSMAITYPRSSEMTTSYNGNMAFNVTLKHAKNLKLSLLASLS